MLAIEPDGIDDVPRQSSHAVRVGAGVPPLGVSIAHVLPGCAEEPVLGPVAPGMVAGVAYEQALWDLTNEMLVAPPRRPAVDPALVAELPVTISVEGTEPGPAPVWGRVNLVEVASHRVWAVLNAAASLPAKVVAVAPASGYGTASATINGAVGHARTLADHSVEDD